MVILVIFKHFSSSECAVAHQSPVGQAPAVGCPVDACGKMQGCPATPDAGPAAGSGHCGGEWREQQQVNAEKNHFKINNV